MGWLFYTDARVKSHADEKSEITRLCTFETDSRKTGLVKAAKVGSTWYAAARVTNIDGTPVEDVTYVTDEDGSITFAAVFLTRYDDGCWGYKDMEESAGPVKSRAPLSLLSLLSQLKDPDSYAHGWWQRCRDWAAIPEYEEGDKIRLAQPVTLTDGSSCQIVTVTHYRRGAQKRRCYRIEETGGLVRLSKETLAGSERIASAKGAASPVLAEFFDRTASVLCVNAQTLTRRGGGEPRVLPTFYFCCVAYSVAIAVVCGHRFHPNGNCAFAASKSDGPDAGRKRHSVSPSKCQLSIAARVSNRASSSDSPLLGAVSSTSP